MNEKKGIAHVRLETDMDETHKTADDISAPSCIASQSIEAIDRRVTEGANYCSQMFVSMDRSLDRITDRLCLLEDHVRDLETRHTQQAGLLGHLSGRLHTVEMGSPMADTDGLRDVAVLYRCNACDPGDGLPPCVCLLSQNLGVPTQCIYRTRQSNDLPPATPAAWKVVDQDLGAIILDGIFAGVPK